MPLFFLYLRKWVRNMLLVLKYILMIAIHIIFFLDIWGIIILNRILRKVDEGIGLGQCVSYTVLITVALFIIYLTNIL